MLLQYLGFNGGFALLCLLIFALLNWLHLPAGQLIDWVIGIASFWWLMVIVTIPWNVHFEAKEVINEADISQKKGIPVDLKQLDYVKKLASWSVAIAVILHISSAIGLYTLAALGISQVGYVSSAATVLLTGLRPAIRLYLYIADRLSSIKRQIKYPREDVISLKAEVKKLETSLKGIEAKLNLHEPRSWAAQQQAKIESNAHHLRKLRAEIEQQEANNQVAHSQILRESKNAISQLTADSEFLGHAREIIRFFKEA